MNASKCNPCCLVSVRFYKQNMSSFHHLYQEHRLGPHGAVSLERLTVKTKGVVGARASCSNNSGKKRDFSLPPSAFPLVTLKNLSHAAEITSGHSHTSENSPGWHALTDIVVFTVISGSKL